MVEDKSLFEEPNEEDVEDENSLETQAAKIAIPEYDEPVASTIRPITRAPPKEENKAEDNEQSVNQDKS